MPSIKLAELERTNARLYKDRMHSGYHASSTSVRNRTSMNGTYVDALYRVLSAIIKIRDAQRTANER